MKKLIIIILLGSFFGIADAGIDKKKYITVDEISPGMDAYCLTVYKGVQIERFELKVVDVVRNLSAGRDAILVVGTDERFIHTGPVAGCSGSPVYIDGRMAGALAFGWGYSKDPLYGVTPIAEMLRTGKSEPYRQSVPAVRLDFSQPLDLQGPYEQALSYLKASKNDINAARTLACPLATSLPMDAFEGIGEALEGLGLFAVSGGGGRMDEYKDVELEPGSIIAVPLVSGDIEMSAVGTVTEVAGDDVYAFGHSFLGEGAIDVPMASGYVNTVVANLVRSFKFGQSIEIKGSLYADESTAIAGRLGRKARTIPLQITVDRFNDDQVRVYNCQMASHYLYTPMLTDACIRGAVFMRGDLPREHQLRYKVRIGIDGADDIAFENFSSAVKIGHLTSEAAGAISLVMNNPYRQVDITRLEIEIEVLPRQALSQLWSVELSDSTFKPGQTLTARITLESYLAGNKTYSCELKIPEGTVPGVYKLTLGGADWYDAFKRKAAPYKYLPENLNSLIGIINDIANAGRDRLYVVLSLGGKGIVIETSQLPDLPISKSLLLSSGKRASRTGPVANWIEKTIAVNSVVIDHRTVEITVEDGE